MNPESTTRAQIAWPTATAVVVANMVGTGVFTSLGFQVAAIPSGFPIVVIWVLGGLLSFCGAVCYAELAAMMPRSGGEYHFLSRAYHPLIGFLSGWVSVTVGFAAPIAVAGLAFGEYTTAVVGWGHPAWYAVGLVVVAMLIHLMGTRTAGRFQMVFTSGKVLLILALIGMGLALGKADGLALTWREGDGELIFSREFGVSLFWVMYAYSGWNAAAYIAGEVREPERNVPLALIAGTGLVTLLYVAVNAVFLHTTPMEAMKEEPEVGFVVARHILGERGGQVMGLLIAFGLISTVSSMIWTGPRVGQVMGEDYRLFHFLSRSNRFGAPSLAIVAQSLIVILLLCFVDFEQILYYIQAILTLSSMMVVAAVIYLRVRMKDAPRPYRTWGYPLTPLLFIGMSIYMLVVFVSDKTAEALWGLLTLVVGWLVYLVARSWEKGPTSG